MLLLIAIASEAQYAIGSLDLEGDLSSWYDGTVKIENTGLFEGPYYQLINRTTTSHVYFINSSVGFGDLVFKGQSYHQVPLLYDTHDDLVIVMKRSSEESVYQPLLPIQDQIQSFTLYGFQFKFMNDPPSGTGFYEVFYESENLLLIIKRRKEEIANERNIDYVEKPIYYLKHEGVYKEITNRKSFYRIWPKKKNELKQLFKEVEFRGVSKSPETNLYNVLVKLNQL